MQVPHVASGVTGLQPVSSAGAGGKAVEARRLPLGSPLGSGSGILSNDEEVRS